VSDDHNGLVGAVTSVADKLVSVVPPAFLALCALNTVFVIGLLWFLRAQDVTRLDSLRAVMDVCALELQRSAH
jgi:hypothetical protein